MARRDIGGLEACCPGCCCWMENFFFNKSAASCFTAANGNPPPPLMLLFITLLLANTFSSVVAFVVPPLLSLLSDVDVSDVEEDVEEEEEEGKLPDSVPLLLLLRFLRCVVSLARLMLAKVGLMAPPSALLFLDVELDDDEVEDDDDDDDDAVERSREGVCGVARVATLFRLKLGTAVSFVEEEEELGLVLLRGSAGCN